jgi:hypothetical protein
VSDEQKTLPRVVVTRAMVGLVHMQVCACKDATDEEILDICNRDNPAGTSNGWSKVCRNTEPEEFWGKTMPTQCADDPARMHFLVAC